MAEGVTLWKRLAVSAAAGGVAAVVYFVAAAFLPSHSHNLGEGIVLWCGLMSGPFFASECVATLVPPQSRHRSLSLVLAWGWGTQLLVVLPAMLLSSLPRFPDGDLIMVASIAAFLAGPFIGAWLALGPGTAIVRERFVIGLTASLGSMLGLVLMLIVPCPSIPQRWRAHQEVPPLSLRGATLEAAVDTLHHALKHPVPFFVCEDLRERQVTLATDKSMPLSDVVEALGRQVGAKVEHFHGGYSCPIAFPRFDCDPFVARGRFWDRKGRLGVPR
jgi:hypothetical protein